jgi:hypothetical protein
MVSPISLRIKSVRWRTHTIARTIHEVDDVDIVVNAIEDEVILRCTLAIGEEVS